LRTNSFSYRPHHTQIVLAALLAVGGPPSSATIGLSETYAEPPRSSRDGRGRKATMDNRASSIQNSLQTMYELATSGFREVFRSPGKVVALRCDAPLQIMFRDGWGQGTCTMRQWHLAQDDFHAMAFELHPLSQDEQRLITVCQGTTLRQENMCGCQEITPG